MFDQIPNVPPVEGAVNVGCGWTANIHMEFTASGHCTVKYLSLNQTTRNRSCRDLEIPPVVIQLGETGLKKTRLVHLRDLVEGRGRKGGVI